MIGVLEVETTDSFKKRKKLMESGINEEDTNKDIEYTEVKVHFSKNMLGEFYKFEEYLLTYVNGKRYDFLYDEELHAQMAAIHS